MSNMDESTADRDGHQVKSVSTLFSILEQIKDNEAMGVTELSRELEMSKGAVHRYLTTLVDEGFAVNDGGIYQLGYRFLDLGIHVRGRFQYHEYIQPKVEQLAEETGERAQFLVEEHGRGIHLHSERGQNAVQTDTRVGKVVYLHATASGKAILANLPHERVEEIIRTHGLTAKTRHTITDPDDLFDTLATVSDRGYALNKEERITGLYAVGVPIHDPEGQIVGGLSVSGPVNRIKDRIENETLQQTLVGTANEIELNISYS